MCSYTAFTFCSFQQVVSVRTFRVHLEKTPSNTGARGKYNGKKFFKSGKIGKISLKEKKNFEESLLREKKTK